MWRIRARDLGVAIAASLGVVACTSSSEAEPAPLTRDVGTAAAAPSAPTDTLPAPPGGYEIEWERSSGDVDVGWITVPLDYGEPDGDTVDLRVARHRADDEDDRIGVLFSNNGGPGAAASTIALNAPAWFEESLVDRFDIVSWDPRGTGESVGVDCIDDDDYDRYFSSIDITPEDDVERDELVALAEQFASQCVERNGEVLRHIGTNNTARDMDAIRQALGEPQVSYFGFSYGSELGGVWATMFPETVRAAVFDGANDPGADAIEHLRQQWLGFGAAFDTFLAECSADSSCEFHNDGDAEGAYDLLLAQLDEDPLEVGDGRAPVNQAVATTGVAQAMYDDDYWGSLEAALAAAADGDGTGLQALRDDYFQRSVDGEYSNLIESFNAITCADEPERWSPEEDDARMQSVVGIAPRVFPHTTGSYFCTFFPASADPRAAITGDGAGPIVVIGTTGDPTTPLESSRAMADALEDGRLVVVEASQHIGYGVNDCVDDIVDGYLIQLIAPENETFCP